MPRTLPSRRARALRPPAVGIIAAALVFAGIAVLLVTGIWAGSLGAPPSWAFDCNDTTCTDLWADARSHYLWTMAGAGLATLLGTALGGLALPRAAVPRRPGPRRPGARHPDPGRPGARRTLATLIVPLLLAAAVLTGAGWSALAFSRPFGLGVALLGLLLAVLAAWRWLRPGASSDRVAYVAAALGTFAPMLLCGVLVLHPLGRLVLVLLLGTFWLGVPAMTVVLLLGTMVMDRLLPRTEADDSQDADPAPSCVPAASPSAPAATTVPAETDAPAATTPAAGDPRPRSSRLATSIGVGAILVLAVLAALPVDAPSADAWKYADSSDFDFAGPADQAADQAPGTGGPSGADRPTGAGGTTGAGGGPASTDAAASPSASAIEAAGLPPCRARSLQLVAEGWDGVTGNSTAALRATNVGATSCALKGMPELTLTQGGEEIALRPAPLAHLEPAAEAPDGIGLAPGSSALSRLYWPGYRTAADQETPQTLTVRTSAAEEPVTVRFLPSPYGDDPGPAPFDLKAGVEGGAVIEVGAWELAPSSAG